MTELNRADKIYIGSALASKVYVGATQAWPIFRPTNLAGCAVWLDASKSYWTNLGAGSQPTITGSPTFRTNALNGMPVLRITQGAGKLRWTSGTGVDKDYTIVYVGRRWSTKAGRVVAAFSTAGNILIGNHGFEGDVCYIEGWLTSPSSPPATTQWKLYSADSTSSAVARFFVNGALNASGTVTPAKGWGGTLCISGYSDDAAVAVSQETDCEIAELVMYNRKLSDAERVQVENYLRTKWINPSLWKPTDLGANLVAWFDSSNFNSVQIVGAGVHQWWNQAPGGTMTVSQTTDAYRPSYASAGGVNYAPAQGSNVTGGPASYDVAMVCRPNPVVTPNDWRTMLRSANNHEMIIELSSTRLGTYNAGFFPAGGLTWPQVDGLAYARIAPSTVAMISRDGGALTSTGTTLPATSAAPTMFGCYYAPPPSQGFGLVKEVIFVPYNLESQRQRIEGYLAWKWGLDGLLPAGHPYKSAPP